MTAADLSLIEAPWLSAPETAAVFAALEAEGGPDCARVVGGAVRNALMNLPVADVDIATILMPERTLAALERAGLRAVPTGVEHGTVTAISGGRPFEITTLRRDVETDGRRAVVAFSTDWAEDAARRDFRLNALYVDQTGRVFDPTGGGVADAAAGRVVFVGDPETRLREDYLRILRFFRFHAWYGRGEPEAAALAACAAQRAGLRRLSAERIGRETLKLLAAADPRAAVRLARDAGVLAEILPDPLNVPRFEALVGLDADPLLRLSALLPDDPAAVAETAARLRLSNAERDRLAAALPDDVPVGADMSAPQARAAIYRLGPRTFVDRVRRAQAAEPSRVSEGERLATLARDWTPPRFPLRGADVAALGVPPGPRTGRLLRAAEDWWVGADFPETGLPERLAELVRKGDA